MWEDVVWSAFLSPRRRRLSSALSSGQSFMNPHPRAVEEGAGPSALSAKVENSDGVCVLVSEQFHVEHLRVRRGRLKYVKLIGCVSFILIK